MNDGHPKPNKRERDIFVEAMELSPQERPAYLRSVCRNDDDLRASVEALLENHKEDDYLERLAGRVRSLDLVGERVGDTIDRYELLEVIGEGGCGIVYRVRQQGVFAKEFALKVIKPGMDTRQVLHRFHAERSALAKLNMPSIARLIDAGLTKAERPYFVMELVRGNQITQYADRQQLTISERLALFLRVCEAIQFAHDNGIIHRDIKPSNILIAEEGAEALPKVIDFGIAKATSSDQAIDTSLVTATGQIIGTLAYMSPEQAESREQIDRRTDVYSLGVMLYELLTGCLPINLNALSPYEQCRHIIEEIPQQLSTKYSGLAENERMRIARNRKAEPSALLKLLTESLDRVVMKCLEKDRDQRFATVRSLAKSVQCLQEGGRLYLIPVKLNGQDCTEYLNVVSHDKPLDPHCDPEYPTYHPYKYLLSTFGGAFANGFVLALVCSWLLRLVFGWLLSEKAVHFAYYIVFTVIFTLTLSLNCWDKRKKIRKGLKQASDKLIKRH